MSNRLLFAVVVVAILLSISSAFCANGDARISASPQPASVSFVDSGLVIPSYLIDGIGWGDFNGDGRMDLHISDKLYLNSGSGTYFGSGITAPMLGVPLDYDNNGFIDLLNSNAVYSNDGSGIFTQQNLSFTDNIGGVSIAWADYDNDGDLDLARVGADTTGVGNVYRNDGSNKFIGLYAIIAPIKYGIVAWGDYDSDGNPDLAVIGTDNNGNSIGKVYRNDGSKFTDIGANFNGYMDAKLWWVDYDSDGDLDLSITGSYTDSNNEFCYMTKIFRNNNGIFVDIGAQIKGIVGYLSWGDCDNDGDLDLAIVGWEYERSTGVRSNISKIYINEGAAGFVDSGISLPGGYLTYLAWGDYDGDGDLDLAASYINRTNYTYYFKLFRNDAAVANSAPTPPSKLSTEVKLDRSVTLNWSKATDNKTPVMGLSYNVRVGTTPGGNDIFSGMATASGARLVPSDGNVQKCLFKKLKNLKHGTYYWSVQSIDTGYKASAWAPEQCVTVGTPYITGRVTAFDGSSTEGITVGADNGGGSCVTDADGYYELWVPSGWSGKVAPSRPCYKFTPAYNSYTSVSDAKVGQNFSVTPPFSQVWSGSSIGYHAFGDYDSDGSMDLVFNGSAYHNQNGSFVDTKSFFTNIMASDIAWGDYENDGDIDLISSYMYFNPYLGYEYGTILGQYSNGSITQKALNGFISSYDFPRRVSLIDVNNDGYLDMLSESAPKNLLLYTGSAKGLFSVGPESLPATGCYANACIDFDNDGDFDILSYEITGCCFYRNDGGTFVKTGVCLPGTDSGYAAWGDYDNDGDLDLAMCGSSNNPFTKIFRNDGGVFVDIMAPLIAVSGYKGLAWGDFDADGDLDLAVAGHNASHNSDIGSIYRNDNGKFVDTSFPLAGYQVEWADVDNDGRLDLLAGGVLFHNNLEKTNTIPSAPTNLRATRAGNAVTFEWNPATDAETPSAGLSYNLRVGTTPGACNILSGMATAFGVRLIPAMGNVQNHLSWTLKGVPEGPLYWSVQAIDTAYAGSPWAVDRLGAVKCQSNGTAVSCGPVVVTAVFGNSFYAEESNRTAGIRVDKAGHGMTIRKSVDIYGTAETDPATGERYILASTIIDRGTVTIAPLAFSLKALGGGRQGLQEAVKSLKGSSWTSASGLNNIGLLVKVFGKVTRIDSNGQYFYIDDGSALADGTMTGNESNIGVRISGDGRSYTRGQFLTVKGISSCFKVTDALLRLIKPIEVR